MHASVRAQALSAEEAEAELSRVCDILAALPASLSADRAALRAAELQSSSGGGDARVTTLLRFRVARKAALHARADALRARLHCDAGPSASE